MVAGDAGQRGKRCRGEIDFGHVDWQCRRVLSPVPHGSLPAVSAYLSEVLQPLRFRPPRTAMIDLLDDAPPQMRPIFAGYSADNIRDDLATDLLDSVPDVAILSLDAPGNPSCDLMVMVISDRPAKWFAVALGRYRHRLPSPPRWILFWNPQRRELALVSWDELPVLARKVNVAQLGFGAMRLLMRLPFAKWFLLRTWYS